MRYRAISIVPDENRFRFYEMYIEKNLFNEHILTTTRGRVGAAGRTMIHFGSLHEIQEKFHQLIKVRKQHGYIEVRNF